MGTEESSAWMGKRGAADPGAAPPLPNHSPVRESILVGKRLGVKNGGPRLHLLPNLFYQPSWFITSQNRMVKPALR